VSVLDVARHDLLAVRRSLLLKTVLVAVGLAPVAGIALGFALTDEVTPRFLLLSTWLVVGFVVPFVATLTAATAIAANLEAGRLRLLLSGPTERGEALLGTLCSRLTVVTVPLALGLAGFAAVFAALPQPVQPGRLAGFAAFTLAAAAAYVSIGLAVSAATRSQTRAVGTALGAFVVTLFWPRIAGILGSLLAGDSGLLLSATAFDVLGRLSPFGAYSQVISDPGAIYGIEVTTPLLGAGAMAVVLLGWIVGPLAVGYRRFSRVDL